MSLQDAIDRGAQVTITGTCTVMLVDAGTPHERLVVTEADPEVLASPELVVEWLSGASPHVAVDRARQVRFGTEGEGLGVVVYRIGEIPPAVDAAKALAEHERPMSHYVTLTRVEP